MTLHTLHRRVLSLAVILGALVAFPACDSDDPEPDPTFSPSFSIASQVVDLQAGGQGLLFFFTPSVNVEITEVLIRNPLNQTERFNGNNNVFLSGEANPLQEAGLAYTRISGSWSFEFNGRDANDGSRNFNVTVTENVSALEPGTPTETR
ncbi:MAG: hypothetical protein AAF845_18775 [Bacteroidota bacterium]